MPDEIVAYTLPEFLKRFGVGRTRAYEEINAGRLKARKNGARTVILAADAQAWLQRLPQIEPKAAA